MARHGCNVAHCGASPRALKRGRGERRAVAKGKQRERESKSVKLPCSFYRADGKMYEIR